MKRASDALTAAYLFLRDVEHKLQMVHDLQTYALPESSEELERCAVRMGYGAQDRMKAATLFHVDHQRHTEMVHRTFRSLFIEPTTSPIFKCHAQGDREYRLTVRLSKAQRVW
jgi:[glutamine synthetase] adenylyltransferase / [glutamine synthetase]-adenylyl-L-tyrosine phosphorylase